MAYDEDLAERLREQLAMQPDVSERRMFGGLAFLLGGRLTLAASGRGGLMARVDPADADELLAGPHVAPMIMRGREMAGWLRVDTEAVSGDAALHEWVQRCTAYLRALGG